jgi:hypothetical protein
MLRWMKNILFIRGVEGGGGGNWTHGDTTPTRLLHQHKYLRTSIMYCTVSTVPVVQGILSTKCTEKKGSY